MKNVFGYTDCTIEGMEFDGKEFITASIPISLRDELYAAIDNESDIEFKTYDPTLPSLAIGAGVAGIAYLLARILNNLAGIELVSKMLDLGFTCFGLLWGLAFFVAFAVLTKKKGSNTEELGIAKAKLKEVKNRCEAALGVPYDRKKVDVFNYCYEPELDEDEEEPDLECDEKSLFREGDKLCIASDEHVFELPIEGFTRYVLKKGTADMFEWHKDIPCYVGEYSQYNIEHDGDDFFTCRYYALQYAEGFVEYEIFFAEYELPLFQAIVDVPVVEE